MTEMRSGNVSQQKVYTFWLFFLSEAFGDLSSIDLGGDRSKSHT